MTESDKTAEKLAASIRKTKAGAASKPAAAAKPAAPRKTTAKKAPARSAQPAEETKSQASSGGSYTHGRRVWPD